MCEGEGKGREGNEIEEIDEKKRKGTGKRNKGEEVVIRKVSKGGKGRGERKKEVRIESRRETL